MPIEWPAYIQKFLDAASFSVQFGETVLRSETDTGPNKVRRRFTRPIDVYSTGITLYQSNMLAFRQFFNTTLNGGATTFYFIDPLTGTKEVFRFLSPPAIAPIGSAGWYRISMSWEKM